MDAISTYEGNPILIDVTLEEYRDLIWFRATAGADIENQQKEIFQLRVENKELRTLLEKENGVTLEVELELCRECLEKEDPPCI